MLTNDTVAIKRRSSSWDGTVTVSDVGSYSIWHEERKTIQYFASDEKERGKGLVFLETDIDLTEAVAVFSGSTFEILDFDRFMDHNGDFHHLEFLYK